MQPGLCGCTMGTRGSVSKDAQAMAKATVALLFPPDPVHAGLAMQRAREDVGQSDSTSSSAIDQQEA